MDVFNILIIIMVLWVYTCQTYQMVHFTFMQFIISIYLHKVIINIYTETKATGVVEIAEQLHTDSKEGLEKDHKQHQHLIRNKAKKSWSVFKELEQKLGE